MAERAVIASLDIDEGEAVAALKATGAQFTVLQGGASRAASQMTHEFDRAGPSFVHHMFSMRAAAAAFLGGFSLAGLISELASLTKSVIMANPAFEDLAKSAGLLKDELLGFSSGGVLGQAMEDTVTWMDRISASIELAKSKAGTIPGTAEEKIGVIGNILFGSIGMAWVPDAISALGPILDKVLATQERAIQQNRAVGGVSALEEWQQNMKDSEAGLVALEKGTNLGKLSDGFVLLDNRIVDTTQFFVEMAKVAGQSIDNIHLKMTSLSEGIASGWNDRPIKEWDTTAKDANQTLNQVDVGVTAAAEAFQLLGASLAQAIAQGGNGRELMRGVMMGLSAAMFARSAEYLAYALAATTPVGAATLGATPPQFAAIAGEFAAVGLVAGLAARGIGSGSRGRGVTGGGGGFVATGSSGGGGQSVNVVVNVEGAIGGSGEQIGRELAVLIKRALKAGAAGGTFDLSTEPA